MKGKFIIISGLRYEHRFDLQINLHYTVEPSHENTCTYSKKSEFLSVCPTSQFYPSYITNQKTGWQPFTWVTSRVLTKRVMCILESFHSSFNNSGLEFCSIAEFKNLQIINYLLNDDCENCGQTSSKREHLKNHNKSQHQCHLNKASSCWRKYLCQRSNKEVIIKLSYPHCFFSYSAIHFLINENSSKTIFY